MNLQTFVNQIRGKLIVSCQALPDEPLHGAHIMAKMAQAAQIGGAAGIRANGPDDIQAIKAAVNLPVIGLYKDGDSGVYITPTMAHVQAIIAAGADVVALDATDRIRPDGGHAVSLIQAIKAEYDALVLADVSTFAEGQAAQEAGADFVAPTLSGYTDYSPKLDGPDFDLLQALVTKLTIPVIAEGRIHTPEQAQQALRFGALAVVVGSAITRPRTITARFVQAIEAP